MKLLLTSSGITNDTIKKTLQDMVGKPLADCSVAFIPTAGLAERGDKQWLLTDMQRIRELVNFMDIVDLASLEPREIAERLEAVDIIVVGGGLTFYLSYWAGEKNFFDALPILLKTKVYVGISAGSQLLGDNLWTTGEVLEAEDQVAGRQLTDDEYDELGPVGRSSSKTAKLVNFVVRPHLGTTSFPKITESFMAERAKLLSVPMYAIDDDTAIRVIDGQVDVVSEGNWKLFAGGKAANE